MVAEKFGKEHRNIIRDIELLKKDVLNFEEMFVEVNIPDTYGRDRKAYAITKDGFTLLAMGFTGKVVLRRFKAFLYFYLQGIHFWD